MKTNINRRIANARKATNVVMWVLSTVSFMFFMFLGCENYRDEVNVAMEKEIEAMLKNGNVPIINCPCNDKPLGIIKGKAVFFVDGAPDSRTDYMTYYPATKRPYGFDDANLTIFNESLYFPDFIKWEFWLGFRICNLPDFAKEWDVQGGIAVDYEGIVYPCCLELGPENFGNEKCYSIVLTQLNYVANPIKD